MKGMENFKIMDDELIKAINNFKNARQKVLKKNVAIWFNKICRIHLLKHQQRNLLRTVEP